MTRVLPLCLAWLIIPVPPGVPETELPGIRRQVQAVPQDPVVVEVLLTATDRQGRHVEGLTAAHLTVKESGVLQTLTSLTHIGSEPLAISLVLDTSNSLDEHFTSTREAAVEVARRLRPGDRAEVVQFNSTLRRELPFTDDVTRIAEVIRRLKRSGSTSLYNAVRVLLGERETVTTSAGAAGGRHVVVLFSDGHDTSSLMTLRELQEVVRRTGSVLYAVAPHGRDLKGSYSVLQALAHTTGGRAYIPSYRLEPGVLSDWLWSNLTNHLLLRYTSSHTAHDGAWRPIALQTSVGGVNLRAREGYFAPRGK